MLILPQLPTQFYGKPEFIQISASWILRLRIKIVEKYLKSPTKCRKFLILGPFTPDPFTIPGLRVPVWFTPTKIGRYQINCAQLCGNGHSAMSGGFLTVESQADFDKWIKSKSGAATSFE